MKKDSNVTIKEKKKQKKKIITKTFLALTERDKEILRDLYKVKMLTTNQIKRLYFTSDSYGTKRLCELKGFGYLQKRPMVGRVGGKKVATCCYITDEGARIIEIDDENFQASKLISPHLQRERSKTNELYVRMKLANWNNWNWLDSRDIKAEYSLNRSSKIKAGIEELFTSEIEVADIPVYGLYIIHENATLSYLNDIKSEIRNNAQRKLNRSIVLFESKKLFEEFGTVHFQNLSLIKMMYDHALKLLPIFGPRKEGLKRITRLLLGVEPVQTKNPAVFTDKVIFYKEKEHYFVELLTNDLRTKELLGNYTAKEAKEDKEVIVLINEWQEDEFLSLYRRDIYSHIKYVICPGALIDRLALERGVFTEKEIINSERDN